MELYLGTGEKLEVNVHGEVCNVQIDPSTLTKNDNSRETEED